jgi:hypothetical protein
MLDSRGFIHVPKPIRAAALLLLGAVLVSAVFMTVYYVNLDNPKDPKYADWILLGMSLIHMSLAGFALALLLFYAEREVSTDILQQKTEIFLDKLLPSVLEKVSPSYQLRHAGSQVLKLGRSDIFGAAYELTCQRNKIKLWVGLNVSRIIVVYWVNAPEMTSGKDAKNHLEDVFQFTFGGAQKVGFSTNFESFTSPNGAQLYSIWSSIKLEQNLLLQPSERLFWMQDIAMMTESFWRTAIRNNIVIAAEEPSPL